MKKVTTAWSCLLVQLLFAASNRFSVRRGVWWCHWLFLSVFFCVRVLIRCVGAPSVPPGHCQDLRKAKLPYRQLNNPSCHIGNLAVHIPTNKEYPTGRRLHESTLSGLTGGNANSGILRRARWARRRCPAGAVDQARSGLCTGGRPGHAKSACRAAVAIVVHRGGGGGGVAAVAVVPLVVPMPLVVSI